MLCPITAVIRLHTLTTFVRKECVKLIYGMERAFLNVNKAEIQQTVL